MVCIIMNNPNPGGEGGNYMKISVTEAAKQEIMNQNQDGKKVRIYVSGIG